MTKSTLTLITILLFSIIPLPLCAQIISTIAGNDTATSVGDGGPATNALIHPYKVAFDKMGNMYIADRDLNRVRKVNTAGIITTIAGTGVGGYGGDGGAATAAVLHEPVYVATDNAGNVYISDFYNSRIRKIDTLGIITTIAGTGGFGYNGDNILATSAEINGGGAILADNLGDIYLADEFNNRIRKIDFRGIITTVVGIDTADFSGDGGPAALAALNRPYAVAIDSDHNMLIADFGNNRIRKVDAHGIITTVAGNGNSGYTGDNGPATNARLNILDVAVDAGGNIFFADAYHYVIRKINREGIITTAAGNGTQSFAGDGGPAVLAELISPTGVTIDREGNICIADLAAGNVRRVTSTLAAPQVEVINFSLSIFPNPVNGEFTIIVTDDVAKEAHITITDIAGRLIEDFVIPTNVSIKDRITAPGIYMVKATFREYQTIGHIVVSSE